MHRVAVVFLMGLAVTVPQPSGAQQQDKVIASELISAVESRDLKMVNTLLDDGADPNATGPIDGVEGVSALLGAARTGETDIVLALLEHGADANATITVEGVEGVSALLVAAIDGETDIVLALLEHGADANATITVEGVAMTALSSAVQSGDLELADVLRSHGARDPSQ